MEQLIPKTMKTTRKRGDHITIQLFFNTLQQLFVPLTHHGNYNQTAYDAKGPLIRSRVPLHLVPKKKEREREKTGSKKRHCYRTGTCSCMASLFCIGQDET
jgi:hypothetical protein